MTSKILEEVLAANAKYAGSFGDKGQLALPPARRFAILTCMDARLDPAKYAGLSEGDAHVIPALVDQNLWAQSRSPMDMILHGWSTSLFHASQQWSTISS